MDKTASLPQVEGAALQNKAYTEAACAAVAQAVAEEMNQLFTSVSDGKSLIASAITDKGVATAADASFQTMSENIQAIQTGPSTGEPLDPMEVYSSTRPTDWLQMPEPQDNEMYLLFHIPDGVSSLLAFTVTCTGSYTVALGTVTGGQFTQQSSSTVASGGKYEAELFADSYGNLTSDGMKQVMVKVSGADILTWVPSTHSKRTTRCNWNVVEIVCKLPQGEKVACGSMYEKNVLKMIRFFTWYGTNSVTDMSYMFGYCYSLTSIPQLDTSSVTDMSSMFTYCESLIAIPQLDTSSVTDMNRMLKSCYSLTAIPQLDTSSVTNMNSMFAYCESLTSIPQLDTSSVTDMTEMFASCYSLKAIPQLDTSSVKAMSNMFANCYSLTAIPQLDTSSVTNMNSMFISCYSLTAIPQLDTSSATKMLAMFSGCYSLKAIPQLDTSGVTDMSSMFRNCRNLTAIPQLDTSRAPNMSSMFGGCYSLTSIPQLDTSRATNMSSMFSSCYSLTSIPQLDTSSVTNMSSMFSSCTSLTAIPQLDTSGVTNMSSMFNDCCSLAAITLDSGVTGWAGYAISLSDCSLGHKALVDLFNSLPTITSSKTLTLTGNPGVAELTDAEKAIATGKNWTLTL